jgi:hypothetical protein
LEDKFGEKYFDFVFHMASSSSPPFAATYFVFNIIDSFWLKFDGFCGASIRVTMFVSVPPHLGLRRLQLATLGGSPSRTQHCSGARHRALAVVDPVYIDYIHVDHNCVYFVYKAK